MEANNPVPAQLAAEVNGPEVGGEVLSAGADSRTLKLFDPHNHMTGGTVRPAHDCSTHSLGIAIYTLLSLTLHFPRCLLSHCCLSRYRSFHIAVAAVSCRAAVRCPLRVL